jgi:D-glycero-D-manno-heptose 1,7-bisphosphate phosphatase
MTTAPNERAPAVFVDRDGTLIRDADYLGDPAGVEVFAGTCDALRRLRAGGFKIIVITNQSGIGRGYFTEEQYRAVEKEVERQIGPGVIDATYFCPDLPDSGSPCRKPAPGMILNAQRDHGIDLSRSFMVGDKAIDAECGRNAGVRTILVPTGFEQREGRSKADWDARDIEEAADIILAHAL